MALIIAVDDDLNVCRVLQGLLEDQGHSVLTAPDVDAALLIIEKHDADLIITDLKMPEKDGMDLLEIVRKIKPAVPVIMVTAHGNIETAVSAIKKGAYDFITKPFQEDEFLLVVNKALAESVKNRNLISAYFDQQASGLPEVVGQAPLIQEILLTVNKISETDSTVLITGETGTGKELIAKIIHARGNRRNFPFVKINCAAIPETLLESELFGYEKGAFTGAATNKPGRFEIADRGTVFLDEIGEMPLHLQAKLLCVLQDRTYERVGGVKSIRIDVRFIAATNQDLKAAVNAGKFRSDLFYRLNIVPLFIPPLRARKDDIVPLTDYFLNKYAAKYRKKVSGITPELRSALFHYDWPGNIRELENVIERMVLLSESDILDSNIAPEELRTLSPSEGKVSFREKVDSLSRVAEKQMIIDALEKTGQNRTKAAEILGISRRTLQSKIKDYGL